MSFDVGQILAVFMTGVCAVLLVRLLVGVRHRRRLDQWAQRRAWQCRRLALAAWHWRAKRRAAQHAAQMAQHAIDRARHRVEKQGNVYKPEAFKEPRKPH